MKWLRRIWVPSLCLLCLLALWNVLGGHSEDSADELRPDPGAAASLPASLDHGNDVLTYHNDNFRSGQFVRETSLTPASVSSGNFGKVGFLPVTGLVDAEPLYVSNLRIAGKERNVVFVATEHDLVYAFDAESSVPLWRVSLLAPRETTSDDHGCQQVTPEIGITATP